MATQSDTLAPNATAVVCEFGNSSLKLRYRRQTVALPYSHEAQWELHAAAIVAALPSPLVLYIATVAPQRTTQLLRTLQQRDTECLVCWMSELLPPSNPFVPYEGVSGIGIDRVLGLIGARRSVEPPIITVDCGTAVTVNVLSPDGRCLGGAIFPSASLQLHALASGTAALPAIEFTPPAPAIRIGTTTEEALLNGVFASVVGGIRELVRAFARQLHSERPPALVLTGGGAPPLVAELAHWWRGKVLHNPWLVLDGAEFVIAQTAAEQIQEHVRPLHALSL